MSVIRQDVIGAIEARRLAPNDDSDTILARYRERDCAVLLRMHTESAHPLEHTLEVYSLVSGQPEFIGAGGSDWYGQPREPPPSILWLSGFEFTAVVAGRRMTFTSGAVTDPRYLTLLRHFATGDAIQMEDAPLGAFVARIA
jgi:hypothetical protein